MNLNPDEHGAVCLSGTGGPHLLTVKRLQQFTDIFEECADRADVASIVFRSSDKGFFSAGADLRELSTLTEEQASFFSRMGQQLFQKMEASNQLTIALVSGWCMGGGLDLLLACDYVLATDNSIFAHPGSRIGIITGFGGTVRLPQTVGTPLSRSMMFTGRRLTAREAQKAGIVTEIHAESALPTRAAELTRTFRSWPALERKRIKASIIGSSRQR